MSKVDGGGGCPIDPPPPQGFVLLFFSRKLLGLTIIPQARVVHELIANDARSAELAINSLR